MPKRARSPRLHVSKPRRLMLLTTTTGYQTQAFVEAAQRLGAAVVFGTDRCHALADPWRDGALPLRFENPEAAAEEVRKYARKNSLEAIVALGDRPTLTAARACQALGLPSHPPEASDACRDKSRSRPCLREAGLRVPGFIRLPLDVELAEAASATAWRVGCPCVVKPLALSASRGVIRANDMGQFLVAFERLRRLLHNPDVQVLREETSQFIQAETYIEGKEIAVEGLVDRGRTRILAIFDKPDPLVGPFFEETIYVTPSRLAANLQAEIAQVLERAVNALGLHHGPFHAELRLNAQGIWILEVAARSIGGLCARTLRFISPDCSETISLEELIIRLALGDDISGFHREDRAAGVMMIPVPGTGIFQEVEGIEQARQTPGVEDIIITVKSGEKLVPLPEGSSYPGFIFARADSPQAVEDALRGAHQKLRFIMSPALPVI
ncbi:MAG: ATP-grasp domain-containing protein [Acidobacteriia bacterium]|nr:ATP-grasp domain-containing protein [Terriglobia bacterium]